MNELPTYTDDEKNVWTIDLKLKQFRKVITEPKPSMEFVEFNSEDGRKLFREYCDGEDEYYNEISSDYRRMSMTLEDDDVDDDTLDMLAEEMAKGDKNE